MKNTNGLLKMFVDSVKKGLKESMEKIEKEKQAKATERKKLENEAKTLKQELLGLDEANTPTTKPIELTAIEKLQFKKFIADNGGMNINDVDSYLESIGEVEKDELIKTFKLQKQTETQKADIQPQSIQTSVGVNLGSNNNNLPYCPKCKSKQVIFNKQGFGVGKAFVGAVLTGGIGLLAGGINKNKIIMTFLKCGHKWKRG